MFTSVSFVQQGGSGRRTSSSESVIGQSNDVLVLTTGDTVTNNILILGYTHPRTDKGSKESASMLLPHRSIFRHGSYGYSTHVDLQVNSNLLAPQAFRGEILNDGVVGVNVGRVLDVEGEGDVGVAVRWEMHFCQVPIADQSVVDGVENLMGESSENVALSDISRHTLASIFDNSKLK